MGIIERIFSNPFGPILFFGGIFALLGVLIWVARLVQIGQAKKATVKKSNREGYWIEYIVTDWNAAARGETKYLSAYASSQGEAWSDPAQPKHKSTRISFDFITEFPHQEGLDSVGEPIIKDYYLLEYKYSTAVSISMTGDFKFGNKFLGGPYKKGEQLFVKDGGFVQFMPDGSKTYEAEIVTDKDFEAVLMESLKKWQASKAKS